MFSYCMLKYGESAFTEVIAASVAIIEGTLVKAEIEALVMV